MSTVLGERSLPEAERGRWRPWLAVAAGLLALYVPTYLNLARTLWREDEYAHGPIILAVFLWLVWRNRDALQPGTDPDFPHGRKSGSVPGFYLTTDLSWPKRILRSSSLLKDVGCGFTSLARA
jgi:hypothetical protein